jgi:hypothetical protein
MNLKMLNYASKQGLTPSHFKQMHFYDDYYEDYDNDYNYDDDDDHSHCHRRIKKRCKGCDHNLPILSPAAQYQRLKIIQNTVRVSSSLYSMNIGALTVFQRPAGTDRVNWNQMSDRNVAHKQAATVSMKSSVSIRPGNMSPGGVGCDIKHNSYSRYLARLKGSRPLRKEKLPEDYGVEHIPFSYIMPVYGGKVVKTSIGTNKCELN